MLSLSLGKYASAYLHNTYILCQGTREVCCIGQDSFVVTNGRDSAQIGTHRGNAIAHGLHRFSGSNSFRPGWIQEPQGYHQEPVSFCLLPLRSELLAFFPGRVSPSDGKLVHQCRLTFHQSSNPNIKSTALAGLLKVQPRPDAIPQVVGWTLDWPCVCHCNMEWAGPT